MLSELQDAEVFSKVRKLVAILVLVIAVAVPLAGCTSSSQGDNGNAQVTYKMRIYGTESCPYCQRMKDLSIEMFGATNTIFAEINPAITGTEANLQKFCILGSVLAAGDCSAPTPVVVLTDGEDHLLALWIGYVEKSELQKILDNTSVDRPLYWPYNSEGFIPLTEDKANKVRETLGLK